MYMRHQHQGPAVTYKAYSALKYIHAAAETGQT